MITAPQPRFRINRHRRLAWVGSALACLLSVIGLALCWTNPAIGAPLKPGLDFTGGTQIQVERACAGPCSVLTAPEVKRRLSDIRLPVDKGATAPRLDGANVQVLDKGQSILLRLPEIGRAHV